MKILIVDTRERQSVTISDLTEEDKSGAHLNFFLSDMIFRLTNRCRYVRPGRPCVEGSFRFEISRLGQPPIRRTEQWSAISEALKRLLAGAASVTLEIVEVRKWRCT